MPTKDMLRFVQNGTDTSIFHVVGRNTINGHLKRLKFLLAAAHDLANVGVQRRPEAVRWNDMLALRALMDSNLLLLRMAVQIEVDREA